ncbi:MAG: translocation/assembly module TamB domain-containing protein [Pseudomonadota bacterium]
MRIWRHIAAILVVGMIALAGPAEALISLLGIKNSMVEFLLEQLSTEGEFEITAEEVTEPEDGVTAIRGLKVADSEGVWLTVQQLDFAWNPSRLLRGEVEFSNLSASGIDVIRAPAIPEGEEAEALDAATPTVEGGAFEWPRSPLTLRIDRMALESVVIRQAVLGHAISFDAEGAARDEGDVQSARLDLTRTDQIAGVIGFDYARNFTDNTLAVNLKATEAAGGLVATLADLPQDAASEVTLTADGPPTDWKMQFDLSLADLITAGGSAQISYEGPIGVNADFAARPGPKMAPNFAALMGAEARLVAKVAEGSEGIIEIEQGTLTSPHANLKASGTYHRITGEADLAVDLTAERGLTEPFDAIDLSRVSFNGKVKGGPGTLAADGDLEVAGVKTQPFDVALADLKVAVRQSGPAENITTNLELAGETEGLRLDKIAPDVIGSSETQIIANLTGNTLTLETSWLDSEVLQFSIWGGADIETLDADVNFAFTTQNVDRVAAAYGVDVQGEVDISGVAKRQGEMLDLEFQTTLNDFAHAVADAKTLTLEGAVQNTGDRTSFALKGNGERLRLDRIGPDLLPKANLAMVGALQGDTLDLSNLRLDAPLLQAVLTGRYDITGQSGTLDYDVQTPDVGPVAALYDVSAGGELAAKGMAMLPAEGQPPRVAGTLTAQGAQLDGTRWGDFTLVHDVEASESPSGSADLSFRKSPYGDGRVKTDFAFKQPTLRLESLSAQALGLTASGDLLIDTETPVAEGALNVNSSDLSRLRSVIGTNLRGAAKGTLKLSANGTTQNAALDLTASGLNAEGLSAWSASIKGNFQDVTGRPQIDARIIAKDATASGLTASAATVTARGPLAGLNISADIDGAFEDEPLALKALARVNAANPTIQANIAQLDASLGDKTVKLNRAAVVTVRGSTISAKGLDVSLPGGGLLVGDATYFGGPIAGDLRLEVPDLAVLQKLADAPVANGALEVTADFDSRSSKRRADVSLSGTGVEFLGVDGTGAMSLMSEIEWRGRAADISATLSGDFGDPVRVTATVPVTTRGGIPELARSGPVQAAVNWTGDVDRLWALVPAPGHVLSGRAVVDLGVGGDIADPAITGGIRMEQGGYQNLDFGTILTDLSIDTAIADGDLALTVTASDGAKGQVTTNGRFALDASGLEISTEIDDAVLVRRDDITARIGGQVAVQGPLTGLEVNGNLVIQEAEVRLINASPPSIVTLEEVLIKGAPPPEEEDGSGAVTLNMDISSPGRMFVRGRGLDSEWKMGLKIRGDAATPDVTGRVEKVRGRLDLIGKGFDLARGRIDFDGGEEIDPRIDIVLERVTSKLTGRIVISGTGSDPQLNFTSRPSLPEDEVLPRVLFGKSSQALTGSQAIQLGLGLATLMDGGAGTLDSARETAGLDQLRIEADEEGNASVAVGKEVAEGIWVGTKQPLGEGGTSVLVEIDVFEEITIDTEAEQGGDASIGIEWRRDF